MGAAGVRGMSCGAGGNWPGQFGNAAWAGWATRFGSTGKYEYQGPAGTANADGPHFTSKRQTKTESTLMGIGWPQAKAFVGASVQARPSRPSQPWRKSCRIMGVHPCGCGATVQV